MVLQHHTHSHGLGKGGAQIVIPVVIHQRACVYTCASVLLDDHPAVAAHERSPRRFILVRRHARLGNMWNLGHSSRRHKIGKRYNVKVRGQTSGLQVWAIRCIDSLSVFAGYLLTCNGHGKALRMQMGQGLQHQIESPLPTSCVVLRGIRMVEADTENQGMGLLPQVDHLAHATKQWLGTIGQDEAGTVAQGSGQNGYQITIHKGLAAGERKLLYAQGQGLFDKGMGFSIRDLFDALIPGLRALQTEGAAEIAEGARMKPKFLQNLGLDIATRITFRCE